MSASLPTPADVWSTGDYADVCDRMIPRLGARLVELVGVSAGEHILDVACGTGNVALPAAANGAVVSALDITPELLRVGAERSVAAGVDVAWVQGDAQAMPFADAAFDCVLSCVGVQFCGDQMGAASELLRVCRPEGRIALVAWTPEGFIGQVLAAVSRATGAAGRQPSPLSWGCEEALDELFAGRAGRIVCGREDVTMPAQSPAAWVDYMAETYGPMVGARATLEPQGGWAPLREELTKIATAHDSASPSTFAAKAEYLTTVIYR